MRFSSVSTLALLAALAAAPAVAQQTRAEQEAPAANVQVETTGEAEVIILRDGETAPVNAEAAGDMEAIEAAEETADPMPTGTETDPVNVEATGVDELEAQAEAGAAEVEVIEAETVETEALETTPVVVETEAVETQPVEVEVLEEGEVAEGTPVQGQIFQQSPASFLASSLIGADVESPGGEEIGEVDDMIVSGDGMIEGVVIGVGGFLGLGEKDVAVQLDQMTITQDPDGRDLTFVLNATEEELEAAPAFRTQRDIQAEIEANQVLTPATDADAIVVNPNAAPVVVDPDASAVETPVADPQ